MAIKHLFERENEDILLMTPRHGGADFDDEGTGSSSGYGDENDDLLADDIDDENIDDIDGDDITDEEAIDEDTISDDIDDDIDDDSTLY